MPSTAINHFKEDIDRADGLLNLARRLPYGQTKTRLVRDDVLRGAWMYAVGALDAYYSDAYADLIASCLIVKSRNPRVQLGNRISSLKIPVNNFFGEQQERHNWRWRMAARELIERDSVLELKKISQLLNQFLPKGQKLFGDVLPHWMRSTGSNARLFGISTAQAQDLTSVQMSAQVKTAKLVLGKRFKNIFQKRHDCIHNCDRPRVAIQSVGSPGSVRNVIHDVRFLVEHSDRHIDAQFPNFLDGLGCAQAEIRQIGY